MNRSTIPSADEWRPAGGRRRGSNPHHSYDGVDTAVKHRAREVLPPGEGDSGALLLSILEPSGPGARLSEHGPTPLEASAMRRLGRFGPTERGIRHIRCPSGGSKEATWWL